MWNFKFHGALSLRLVASNSPLPQRPQGRAYVLLGPSRHWSCLPRRPFFVTRPRPLTKIKEPRCTVGYPLTGEPCRLAYPPHSAPVLPGLFHASSSNAKRETAACGLATASRTHSRASEGQGGWTRLVVKSIFLVRTHTAIKFFNAIQFFLCSSTGTQLLVSSLQIISGD